MEPLVAATKSRSSIFVLDSSGFTASRLKGKWTKSCPFSIDEIASFDAVSSSEAAMLAAEARAALLSSPERQTRQQMIDSKPMPDQFEDREEFEEAYGYWMSHQGRILAMTAPDPMTPAPSSSDSEK